MPNFEKVGNKLKITDTVETTYDIAKLKAMETELTRRLNQVKYFLTQAEILDIKPKEGKDGGA